MRQVVFSTNMNPDYMYYVPLTAWAWKQIGWEPVLLYVRNFEPESNGLESLIMDSCPVDFFKCRVDEIPAYRSATVAQICRLYAAGAYVDGFIMTADADMIPLSNYWNPEEKEITVYGYDLTGYKEFPICYIAMSASKWMEIMRLKPGNYNERIESDLNSLENAKSDDFYKWWGVDQQLITERLKPHNPTLINRGQYANGYAVGRMDRGNWNYNHDTFIDMHCFQQLYHKGNGDKFDKTMELLTSIWPDQDFGWFEKYTDEFRRLTGHA